MAPHTIVLLRRIAVAGCTFAWAAGPAIASAATPTPAPTPPGFTARGHANISVTSQARALNGSVQMAMQQRGNLARVDVLSVQSDVMPLPPIRFSIVVDRNASVMTIWNDVTKRYFRQPFVMKAGGVATMPTSSATGKSPFAALDIFTFTMKLTGHTMTNGVATTGIAFDILAAKKGDTATTHVTAASQLVDDTAFFPMTFDMTVEPANMSTKATFAYAVDSFARRSPPLSQFAVPAGYAKAKSLLDAIKPDMAQSTRVSPRPMMTPRPMSSPMSSGMPMTSPMPMPMSSGMPMTSPMPMSSGMPMASPTPAS